MRKIGGLLLVVLIAGCTFGDQEKPNIIVIQANKLRCEDVSVYRTDTVNNTPNIEKLAQEGVCFTNGYAPFSNPMLSEYALMTGIYPLKEAATGEEFPVNAGTIKKEQITLPKVMKTAGYVTAAIGKWHLEDLHGQTVGFDYSCVGEKHLADDTDEMKQFISLNKKKHFFLYWGADEDSTIHVDNSIGELLSCLKAEDLLEKTLVVFSGNNGIVGVDSVENDAVRIPLFIYWKGKISPFVSDALVSQIDLMASLGKLVDVELPEGLDSREYLDAFMGKTLKARAFSHDGKYKVR